MATAPTAKHHECTQHHGERTLPLGKTGPVIQTDVTMPTGGAI